MRFVRQIAFAALVAGFVPAAQAISITLDRVQQRYPWNGLVDIDYTIASGGEQIDPAWDRVRITVINKAVSPVVSNVALRVDARNGFAGYGPLPMTEGAHRVTWDATADGIAYVSDKVSVEVSIVRCEPKFMVIDLRGGPTASAYPVSIMEEEPAGGFNSDDAYKGDYLVLRYIPAGSFVMGSLLGEYGRRDEREAQHNVLLTKGFYMGIFAVTQQQYENVMGSNPANNRGPYHPVEQVSWNSARGTLSTSFLGLLRARTGGVLDFDLPTEAQWEYACRAGTTGTFYIGGFCATEAEAKAQMDQIGSYGRAQTDSHDKVGSFPANGFGLYDMLGNVMEWCLDGYQKNIDNLLVDPSVSSSGTLCTRGGHYCEALTNCRCAARGANSSSSATIVNGFRIACKLK